MLTEFAFAPWMRDPAAVRSHPLGASERWDNRCSAASDPQGDIQHAACALGKQVTRIVMSRWVFSATTRHPNLLCFIVPHHGLAPAYGVTMPTVQQIERIFGAYVETPEAGLVHPGALTICPEMGPDVLVMAGDGPGDCYLLRGVLDVTNTQHYGADPAMRQSC